MNKSLYNYFQECISYNYSNFEDRARCSEYWGFVLYKLVVYISLKLVLMLLVAVTGIYELSFIAYLWSFGLFVPSLAVGVRRLHDTGRSGWWYLIALTGIGVFVLFYWFCSDSEPGANKWGPNPKEIEQSDIE